jgi:transglutaminase-like putative cysteine protease
MNHTSSVMKIHPLMLAAAIAFWGWQSGQWLAAAVAAPLLCASFYVSLHWEQTTATLCRVADFCGVFALLLGVYFYVVNGNPQAIILFFLWLPMLFLPLALTHAYSASERMDASVLFWSLRRDPLARPATFDPWFAYYAVWLFSASAANNRSEWFYVGLVALVSWPLVRIRPWSYRVGTWGVAFSLAIGMGYGLHLGLAETQRWLETAVPEWISGDGSRTDPYRATTDIGHIGKLKDSDAIVLRVFPAAGAKPPALLHRASYNTYFGNAWIARGVAFANVNGETGDIWPLNKADAAGASMRVTLHDYTVRPNPVLSLPTGAVAVEALKAVNMQRNPLGAVQIVREPGFFSYTVAYNSGRAVEGLPNEDDTRLPPKEREAFAALAAELGLKQLKPDEAALTVKQYFALGYRYSTYQKDTPLVGSAIVDFLLRSKSGHCEYFATATALLLRAGGIPARYATGFGVLEKSDLENGWLVRTRHAHAWVRAYVNGAWIDIDTTPPAWGDVEADAGSGWAKSWSKVTDVWSWLRFRISQAWANSDERKLLIGGLIVVLPFALWLAWRLFRSRRVAKNNQIKQILTDNSHTGADSEFYRVEQRLAQAGLRRQPHETARAWLARLEQDANVDTSPLLEIVTLHNRYRFDPGGLPAELRTQLRERVQQWLAAQPAAQKS